MTINSTSSLLLLIPFFFLYYFTKNITFKKVELILFSLIFIYFIDIIAFTTLLLLLAINFSTYKLTRKNFKPIAIGLNLSLLVILKFILIPKIQILLHLEIINLIYVFVFLSSINSISELTRMKKDINLLDFLLLMFFFPKNLIFPNYKISNTIRNSIPSCINKGLFYLSLGLFQINILTKILNITFIGGTHCASMNFGQALTFTLANSTELFLNLFGYINLFRGIILILGLDVPKINFNPFRNTTIINFWESIAFIFNVKSTVYSNKFINKKHFRLIIGLITFTILFFRSNTILFFLILNVLGILTSSFSYVNLFLQKHKIISSLITFIFINISLLFFRVHGINEVSVVIKGLLSIGSIFLYYNELYILWSVNANYITWVIIIGSFYFLSRKSSNVFKSNWINLTLAIIFTISSLMWIFRESIFILYA